MRFEISGPADTESLLNALRRVADSKEVYSLLLSDGISERVFYFAIGGMRVIRGGRRQGPRLGEMLVAAGRLTEQQVEQVVAACEGDTDRFGRVAVQEGLLSADEAQEVLRTQVEEELLDMFLWDDAELRLIKGQPPKEVYERRRDSAALSGDVHELVTRVLARVDQWTSIAGRMINGHELYELTDRGRAAAESGPHAALLSGLDGKRTASDVVAAAGLSRVPSFEFLLHASQDGQIRRLAGASHRRMSHEERARRIDELERALEVAVDSEIVRLRLARHHEAAGGKSRAAGLWRELGDEFRHRSNFEQALDAYRECIRLLPTEFEARELILEIHTAVGDMQTYVRDGRPLAELFVKNNLLNRAKNLLVRLVSLEPDDVRLKRQLITVLIGLGERELALKYLRELAKLLEDSGASEAELKDVYVRVLALDPSDPGARLRLDTILGRIHRRRVMTAAGIVTVILLGGLSYLFWKEQQARAHMAEVVAEVTRLVNEQEFDQAEKLLEDAIREYPRSPVAKDMGGLLERVNNLHYRHLGLTEQARQVAEARGARLPQAEEQAAKSMRESAEKLLAEGKVVQAHAIYVELIKGFPLAAALEDALVPVKVRVLPEEALVILDGEPVGTGERTVEYDPSRGSVLRVELDGFVPYEETLVGPHSLRLDVALAKPELWRYRSDATFAAAPLVVDGTCYVAGRDRRVTALATADGTLRWCVPLGLYGDVAVRPLATAGGLLVVTALGEAVCLDPDSGDIRWRRRLGTGVERQPALVTADLIVITGDDGSLHALAADGTPKWSQPAGTTKHGAAVRVTDTTIGYVDRRGGLAVARVQDGKLIRRSAPMGLRGAPVRDPERVWACAGDQSVRMLTADADVIGKIAVAGLDARFAPEVDHDVAFVVCGNGRITGVRNDGITMFDAKLEAPPSAPLTYADGRLYVPGQGGELIVMDAGDEHAGRVLWRHAAGAGFVARPVVTGEAVILVTRAGDVLAVGR